MSSARFTWIVAVILVLAAVCAEDAQAQSLDPRAYLKPHVMVLLDTSGSMSWVPSEEGIAPYNSGYDGRYNSKDPYQMRSCLSDSLFDGQSNNPSDDRSRLMIVQEVLTGRLFEGDIDTKCDRQFFSNSSWTVYPIKKGSDPKKNVPIGQHDDGMLDVYREKVKFGLMTFDSSKSTNNGSSGWYSWGPDYKAAYSDFTSKEHKDNTIDLRSINMGARHPQAAIGRTVATGYSDDFDIASEFNSEVQANVLNATPEGGTPLAAMMSDARHYFRYHCDERSPNQDCYYSHKLVGNRPTFLWEEKERMGVDPYGECRPRAVILIADGGDSYDMCYDKNTRRYSTCYNDAYPYKDYRTADLQAEDLLAEHNIKTYVIGFGPNRDMDERLRSIAYKGGTCDDVSSEDCFFKAENFNEMYRAMTRVMSDMLSVSTSRTRTATTSRVAFRDSNVGMYEVAAGFEVDPNSPFWVGRLERSTYECNADGVLVAKGTTQDLASRLKSRAEPRVIYTSTLETRSKPLEQPPAEMPTLATALDDKEQELFPTCEVSAYNESVLEVKKGNLRYYKIPDAARYGVTPGGCVTDNDCATTNGSTFQCLHGNCEEVRSECSTGADCCNNSSGLCSYLCYSGSCRKVGKECTAHDECGSGEVCHLGYCRLGWGGTCTSNDVSQQGLGDISHSNPTIVGGPELDLPIPAYQAFRQSHGGRDTMLYIGANDGMLHAFLLGDMKGDSPVSEGDEVWSYVPRAVQERLDSLQYGRGLFVDGTPVIKDLRVSNDGVTDTWRTVLIGGLRGGGHSYFALDVSDPYQPRFLWEHTDESTGFSALGLTYAEAEMGTIALKKDGAVIERGAAFLSGGVPSDDADSKEARAFYVVDVESGALLRAFTKLDNGEYLRAITGTPVAFNAFPGAVVSRVFVTDDAGRLLRVDTSSPDPQDWSIDVFFDPTDAFADARSLSNKARQNLVLAPAFSAPAVALNNAGELVVVYGNGDTDDLTNFGDDRHFMVSVTEELNLNDPTAKPTAKVNWFTPFSQSSAGEKLTGPPVVFDGVAYFATFVPGEAACDFGFARVYGALFEGDPTSSDTVLVPAISFDEDADLELYTDFALGTTIMGVEVANRPACVPAQDPSDPQSVAASSLSKAKRSTPQLILQTGAPAYSGAGGNGSGQPGNINTTQLPGQRIERAVVNIPEVTNQSQVLSWGFIYE